jgi:predicted Zn-dependent protease
MKKIINIYVILISLSLYIVSCSTVPVTGRKQLNIIPAGQLLSMSYQQYEQFLKENKKSNNKQQTALVKKVGNNIKNAVQKFYEEKGLSGELEGYQWEFHLIESEEVNAWCMPGGKVVFYEGIIPVCEDEKGIAVVMGHEVAHAIAEHGNERMSQGLIAQLGGIALSEAIKKEPAQTQQLWMAAYGLGAQVGVILPFSRTQESEADRLGLIFMSIAGYDPNEAVEFWQRMSQLGGQSPPEFLSTHPSNQTRINDIKEHIPEAMEYYKK